MDKSPDESLNEPESKELGTKPHQEPEKIPDPTLQHRERTLKRCLTNDFDGSLFDELFRDDACVSFEDDLCRRAAGVPISREGVCENPETQPLRSVDLSPLTRPIDFQDENGARHPLTSESRGENKKNRRGYLTRLSLKGYELPHS